MSRQCPFPGCSENLPESIFACRKHWYQISRPDQEIIWGIYRRWQAGDVAPDELLAVQKEVIDRTVAKHKNLFE